MGKIRILLRWVISLWFFWWTAAIAYFTLALSYGSTICTDYTSGPGTCEREFNVIFLLIGLVCIAYTLTTAVTVLKRNKMSTVLLWVYAALALIAAVLSFVYWSQEARVVWLLTDLLIIGQGLALPLVNRYIIRADAMHQSVPHA
jgi:hypothetical protein